MNTMELLDFNSRIAMTNTLGHAVLVETLKMAAYYLNHSNGICSKPVRRNMSEAKSCYIFVQGTGLDLVINQFGMDYNPDKIRDVFNYCVRHSA